MVVALDLSARPSVAAEAPDPPAAAEQQLLDFPTAPSAGLFEWDHFQFSARPPEPAPWLQATEPSHPDAGFTLVNDEMFDFNSLAEMPGLDALHSLHSGWVV